MQIGLSFINNHPSIVHSPPGSPHPELIITSCPHQSHNLRSHHLSLLRPFVTPDVKPNILDIFGKTHLFHKSFLAQSFWFLNWNLDCLHGSWTYTGL